MKLCASRAFWLVAYPSQDHETLFDAHPRFFAALGCVAGRGIHVNMRAVVDKVHKGKGRPGNARLGVICEHQLYDLDCCNVAAGLKKDPWERNVQDSRRRSWINASKHGLASFVELNNWFS